MSSGPRQVIYEPPPSNAVGVVGFVFAIIGFVTCGLVSPLALLISLVGIFKAPRGFAVAGTIIGLLGTVWLFAIGFALIMSVGVAKDAVESGVHTFATAAAFERGRIAVEAYQQEHGSLPDGIEGNKLVLDLQDGWEQPIHYTLAEDGSYTLRSAGADGEFHTPDDMTSDTDYGLHIDSTGEEIRFGPGEIELEAEGDEVLDGEKEEGFELPDFRASGDTLTPS